MQQMRRPGWRTAAPSSAPAARPTSSWKPLDGGRRCLGMRSEVRGDVRAGVGGGRSCGGMRGVLLGSNLGHRWHRHTSTRWVQSVSLCPLFFLSESSRELSQSKAHFLPSFGSLDQRKWDSRSSPARLLSHAPSASPWGGRTDGRTDAAEQRTRRR